ncbi:MAG TPA: DUF6266 family protein, partial [Prolixibacteraceae bacterium]|nr:DUF6266 family protein [Prolixibacteraceae bacterium]
GGFSGKVGTVIGGNWNGINYMRGLPTSYTNPRTEAQLSQRAKFAETIKFLRPLTPFLRVGFKNAAYKMSGFNAAMSYTLKNALTGTYPAYSIDYTKVLVSRGPLAGAQNPAGDSTIPGKVDFTWENNSSDTGAQEDDKVLLVIYCPTLQKAVTVAGGSTRITGAQSVTVPDLFSGLEVQCYIGFQDATQSVLSDSAFVASIVCA